MKRLDEKGHIIKLDEFTKSYIETALWCSLQLGGENENLMMDEDYDIGDIHPDSMEHIIGDCKDFQEHHWDLISKDPSRAGHDFWLTRNHHGAGFWDGDWEAKAGRILTESSHAYGSEDWYIGDDGKIHAT